jgi:hypothetical protein
VCYREAKIAARPSPEDGSRPFRVTPTAAGDRRTGRAFRNRHAAWEGPLQAFPDVTRELMTTAVDRSGFDALGCPHDGRARSSILAPGVLPIAVAAAKVPSILGEACLAELVALHVPRTSTTRPSHSLSAVKPNPADQCATVWQATP